MIWWAGHLVVGVIGVVAGAVVVGVGVGVLVEVTVVGVVTVVKGTPG